MLYYREDVTRPSVILSDFPEVAELFPEKSEYGWETLSDHKESAVPSGMALTAGDIASTGIVELVAERELTVPLGSSGTRDTVYNDLARREYPMDGYTVVITDFRLTHFGAEYKGSIRKDGDLMIRHDEEFGDSLEDEPLARYYELLRPDGSPLAGEENFSTYGCDLEWSGEEGRDVIAIDGEVRGILPLDGMTRLLLTPVEYETAADGAILSKNYLLDEAISITPIYNPDKPEPIEEPDYGAAEDDDLSK